MLVSFDGNYVFEFFERRDNYMLAGEKLRTVRDKLGFTMKDVELASLQLVEKYKNIKYWIPQSRLSHIESKGIIPNMYRLHALCTIYRIAMTDVLGWYGIGEDPSAAPTAPPRTHLAKDLWTQDLEIPIALDPAFDEGKTSYIRRMIQQWGVRPMMALQNLQRGEFTYGYVGTEDYSMYPLILPGSFVQIDQRLTEIETGPWASEWERPIYFLETRETYICGWCAVLSSREIQVQPHALSGLASRNYKISNEIEVVGQVVGIATKLRRVNQTAEREPAMTRTHI